MRALFVLGLTFLLMVPAGRALAFGNCVTDADYLGRFQAGLAPQPCDEIYYVTVHAATGDALLRLIALSSAAHGDDSTWIPKVEALALALGHAIDAMGTPRLPDEITVLLTDVVGPYDPDLEVHADTTRIPGGECRVAFFKLPGAVETDLFIFTLAHEIFHCAQYETWLAAAAVPEAGWWVEGSAEYFAYLAAPDAPVDDGWIDGFDQDSRNQSLVDMEYQNVVFFAWLANRGGPGAVGTFLTQMRAGDQRGVLRGLVPLDDWKGFVETWLDGGVSLPGGRAVVPEPMAKGERVFQASGELAMSTDAYVIERWGVTFPEDKKFVLSYEASGSPTMSGMRLLSATGGWAEPPAEINTCDGEQRHILYLTSVDGPAEAVLNVELDETLSAGACCLIGAWAPTADTLDAEAALMMEIGGPAIAAAGVNFSCAYDGGGWLIYFLDDGSGRIDYDAHTSTCTAGQGGGAMGQTMARSGTTWFDWTSETEGIGRAIYGENSVNWTHTMKIGGMEQSHSAPDAGSHTASTAFAYACTEDRLKINGLYGLTSMEMNYNRADE